MTTFEINMKSSALANEAAEAGKSGNIDLQIDCLEKAIALKPTMPLAYFDLTRLYKKLKRPEDELRVCLFALKTRPNNPRFQKRVRELQGTQPKQTVPTRRYKVTKEGKPWGDIFFDKWNSLTKDDFYLEKEESEEYDYSSGDLVNPPTITHIWYNLCLKDKVKEDISEMIGFLYHNPDCEKAREAENNNDYLSAVKLYEKLAAEKLPYSDHYGHIPIYKKFRLREAELESILELKELCKKENERYMILTKKFTDWFPESEFAKDTRKGCCCANIGFINFPPIQTRILKETEERVEWLQSKLSGHK